MSEAEARAKSLDVWNDMAAGWDTKSDYLWETSRKVGEWMVEKIDPKPGQVILELAAGPGITGFIAAKLAGEGGRLISTDFASSMVEVAKKKAADLGVTNAEFRQMDAENIDLPDDSVDAVLCRWGYMLMMDPVKALTETRRVLRSGGKLAFSVWGQPQDNPWATVPGMVMVSLGKMPMPDPNASGGIFSMAEASTIERMLKEAGFSNWDIQKMEVTWKFADDKEVWSFMNEVAGAISLYLRDLDDASRLEVKHALMEQFQQFRSGEGYAAPGVVLNVVAE